MKLQLVEIHLPFSERFYTNILMAIVVANLAAGLLRSYGSAQGVPSNITTLKQITQIVHIKVRPNLQLAFHLTL